MPIIIQKFGGTSVSSGEAREAAIGRIVQAKQRGYDTVVVVSAMGRAGDPYATDTLIGLVNSGEHGFDTRDLDLVMVCGEIISAGVFVSHLRRRLPKVALLTGWQAGIITDGKYGDARIIDVRPDRLQKLIEQGYTVVVAGFQGMSEEGEINTLGRGGSDTTASALGVALGAESVEIYTDVDGIMTADPRIVQQARLLEVMDYSEVLQLAYEGAKVVHPRAIELVMQRNIPLVVRRTQGELPGTSVISVALYEGRRHRPVIGVAQKTNIAQVIVQPEKGAANLDFRLFSALAKWGVSVDLINVSPDLKLFAVKEEDVKLVQAALTDFPIRTRYRTGCCKVSVIGVGMRGIPGIMSTVTQALNEAGVEILQTSDSHMTIACLIDQSSMAKAVNALHEYFNLASV